MSYAMRSTNNTSLQAMPSQLLSDRDMVLNIQHQIDWAAINKREKDLTNNNYLRENKEKTNTL